MSKKYIEKNGDIFQFKPVIIIGAGRSGTNMLRDVLTRFDNISTWPCDEINYIWRHGNRDELTDEFESSHATPLVKSYIRSQFVDFASSSFFQNSIEISDRIVLEKTCANSLRIDFVDAVLPEARYIYIVRDGRDVVSSAIKRWKAPLDVSYLLAKVRYVPKTDLFYYGFRYFSHRIGKLFHSESRLKIWGPKFKDWQNIVVNNNVATVCAYQWNRCIERSAESLSKIPDSKVFKLRYEEFVSNPEKYTKEISKFLEISVTDDEIKVACDAVSSRSVGIGARNSIFSEKDFAPMISGLKSLGYVT